MNAIARGWQGAVIGIALMVGMAVFSSTRVAEMIILALITIQTVTLRVLWPDIRSIPLTSYPICSHPCCPHVRHPAKRSSIEVAAKIHIRAYYKT
jgi:hypothetical protein